MTTLKKTVFNIIKSDRKTVEMENLSHNELIDIINENIQEKENLNFLLDSLNGIGWEFDIQKNSFTYVSQSSQRLLGYKADEWTDFASWKAMIHEEDRERVASYSVNETRYGKNHVMEYRMLKKDGEVIWILDTVTLGKDLNGKAVKLFGFNIDITEKKSAQQKIEKEHKFLESILNGISDPVMIINADYSVNLMNSAIKEKLKGRSFIDPSSPKCYEISHHRDTPCEGMDDPCPLKTVLESKKAVTVLHNHRREDGSDDFVELAASPLFDENQNCIGIIESARDVNSYIRLHRELEEKTRELQYEATHDYLTGLPNRALFMDRFEQSIRDAKRHKSSLALFFMDLDHFKEINDTLGHHMGDAALQAVCKKFQSCTRASDVLSRLAGDEFTVILKDIKNEEDVSIIAQKFLDIFEEPLLVKGHLLKLSVSIGISLYKYSSMNIYDETVGEKLLHASDLAMYEAKAKGKSNFQFAT
ncbi:MAG: diguanylate cyclase [Helicobacteraceae bacterium]|nr:diguanylate cyclase [Candidatus Sulfurimonas ponti]MBL6972792.1 diguanylate cyclase [Sulfurimonas sp.]